MSPLVKCNDPISREAGLWIIVQKITSHWTPAVSGLQLLFLAPVSGLKIWAVKTLGSSASQIQKCYLFKAGWRCCIMHYVIFYSKRSPPQIIKLVKREVVLYRCVPIHSRWPTFVLSRWEHKEQHHIYGLWHLPTQFSVLSLFFLPFFVLNAQKQDAQWNKTT